MHPIDKGQMVAIVDGIGVFIQEDILIGGRDDGRLLAKGIKVLVNLIGVPTVPIDAAVHRHASNPRIDLSPNLGCAFIRRALVNFERLVVIPKKASWGRQ